MRLPFPEERVLPVFFNISSTANCQKVLCRAHDYIKFIHKIKFKF